MRTHLGSDNYPHRHTQARLDNGPFLYLKRQEVHLRLRISTAIALIRAFFGDASATATAVVSTGAAWATTFSSEAPQCQSTSRTKSFLGRATIARAVLNSYTCARTHKILHTQYATRKMRTELERRTALRIFGVPQEMTSSTKRLRLPSLGGTG